MIISNYTKSRIPRKFIEAWVQEVFQELKKRKIFKGPEDLVVVFVSEQKIKNLNKQFRGLNKVTDILSFSSDDPEVLGELVISYPVIVRQAQKHGLTIREEMAYMILHGILHLLGYDHETSPEEAHQMFLLQDQIFEKLI